MWWHDFKHLAEDAMRLSAYLEGRVVYPCGMRMPLWLSRAGRAFAEVGEHPEMEIIARDADIANSTTEFWDRGINDARSM